MVADGILPLWFFGGFSKKAKKWGAKGGKGSGRGKGGKRGWYAPNLGGRD